MFEIVLVAVDWTFFFTVLAHTCIRFILSASPVFCAVQKELES